MAATAYGLGPVCRVGVGIYQGNRQLFPDSTQIRYQIFDGNHNSLLDSIAEPEQLFGQIPFQDSPADNFTILANLDGFGTAGFMPVRVSPDIVPVVRLMLIPDNYKFDFAVAQWDTLKQNRPDIWNVISGTSGTPSGGNSAARPKYESLMMTNSGKPIACMLNILEGMSQIQLGANKTPLDFIKDIRWDDPVGHPVKQDRFYCWADRTLADAIIEAGKLFAPEPKPSTFHGGTATRSWKEAEYGEANVQFTFHDGVVHPQHSDWVQLEPDIDYFKDLAAHFFGEVFVNWFGSLTEPAQVYALRFNTGNLPGKIPFEPPYFIR